MCVDNGVINIYFWVFKKFMGLVVINEKIVLGIVYKIWDFCNVLVVVEKIEF